MRCDRFCPTPSEMVSRPTQIPRWPHAKEREPRSLPRARQSVRHGPPRSRRLLCLSKRRTPPLPKANAWHFVSSSEVRRLPPTIWRQRHQMPTSLRLIPPHLRPNQSLPTPNLRPRQPLPLPNQWPNQPLPSPNQKPS
jgi:hypothetical protein